MSDRVNAPENSDPEESDPDHPPSPDPSQLTPAKDDRPPRSVLWIASLFLSLLSLGVHDFIANHEDNRCAMTYMYEWPLYLPVPDPDLTERRFPHYRLYAYAEGDDYSKSIADGEFSGIPVLFIPGNAGSYKQVRSLASVALRKALEDEVGRKFHFDYFAVDFNEEFSALYGGSLEDQAEFAALCVERILGLYEKDKKGSPESVVLVGHSIGGMVARAVFLRPKFDADKVSIIITLATPHQPVVVMDYHTRTFYDRVDRFWNLTRATELKDVTFVSIGGGERDIQVRSGLTLSRHADINVVTTDVPGVWVSTDHQCIVWCKQLVLALNRALFDCVHKNYQISTKREHRKSVFKYHLVHRSAGKRFKTKITMPKKMEFDKDGFWSDSILRQFAFAQESVAQNSHVMIKIIDDPKHQSVAIDAVNLDNDSWLFGCKATTIHKNTRLCESGDNLSHKTRILPSKGKRKSVTMNLQRLGEKYGYTHLLVYIPKKSENVKVNIDVYNERDRSIAYEVPRWISFWKSQIIVQQTIPSSLFYNISLLGIDSPWQAYDITVSPVDKCDEKDHFGIMRFVTPWAQDATQALIGLQHDQQVGSKLQSPKPDDGRYYKSPEMIIFLNPSCQYKIEIQASISQMWGQMVRFYAPMLLPLCTAAVLLVVSQQMKSMHQDDTFPSFISVITSSVSPISVVMPSRILSSIIAMGFIAEHVPISDFRRLADLGVDFGVLPIVLFFSSIGLVTVLSAAAWLCVVIFGNVASKTVTRFLTRFTRYELVADVAVAGVSRFPFILSGMLIALGAATCGALALCIGTFFHFLLMFSLYEDYLKTLVKETIGLEEKKENKLSVANFQFSMLLLWAFAAVLNAPSLLAWTKNFSFQPSLQPDPSLVVAVVLSTSLAVTFGEGGPKSGLRFYDRLSFVMQILCVLMVLYGCVSIYRVNYFLSAAFVAIVIHQVFAPEKV